MTTPKQNVQATLNIYKGLPFSQLLLYQTQDGQSVDLTGKKARLQLRRSAADPTVLYEFSTVNGKIVLGPGTINIGGMTDVETAALDWEQAVGHLVVEEIPGKPLPLAFFMFNVDPSTTGVPL